MSRPPPGPLATSLFSSCCLPSLHLLLLQVFYLKHCQRHLFSCSSLPLTFMIIATIFHLDNSPIVVRPVVEEYLGGRLARTCTDRRHRCVHLKGHSHFRQKLFCRQMSSSLESAQFEINTPDALNSLPFKRW